VGQNSHNILLVSNASDAKRVCGALIGSADGPFTVEWVRSRADAVQRLSGQLRGQAPQAGAPHRIGQHELRLTGSIGIVVYPDDGTDAEELLKHADFAMYHAKDQGRNNYQFFEPDLNVHALERQMLESGLRHAIDSHELVLHYQPKVNLKSGAIVGAEAFVRWCHPERGLILPSQFVPIAEICGTVIPMGRWVLREACRQARAWQGGGLGPLRIAINVSAPELRDRDFLFYVRQVLQETGLEPRDLELELREAGQVLPE
jgi:diguanylate cyclase